MTVNKINDFYKNNFDLARLIAAFLVLFTHGFELLGNLQHEPLYMITNGKLRCSTIGLYIFFFTSGFLVTKSFLNTNTIGEFIWKRFLRIFPALIMIVLISVFIIGPIFTSLSLRNYFSNFLTYQYLFTTSGIYIRHILPGVFEGNSHYDHGVNGSLWSISLELKLYFLLILFGTLKKKGVKGIFTYLLFACMLFLILLYFNLWDIQSYFSFLHFSLFILFWLGSFCCINYNKIILNPLILLALGMIWLICIYYLEPLRIFFELAFFIYLTLFCCYTKKTISLNIDLSYGFYIYAFPITQIVIEVIGKKEAAILISVVIIIASIVSYGSWKLIEKKFLGMKKNYTWSSVKPEIISSSN